MWKTLKRLTLAPEVGKTTKPLVETVKASAVALEHLFVPECDALAGLWTSAVATRVHSTPSPLKHTHAHTRYPIYCLRVEMPAQLLPRIKCISLVLPLASLSPRLVISGRFPSFEPPSPCESLLDCLGSVDISGQAFARCREG